MRAAQEIVRFGPFELDLRTSELRKNGVRIRLQDQPFKILAMLLERPGELITRDEIQSTLWPNDTAVDFEYSINNALTRLRAALSDSARDPRYIETLSKRGYRFVAPVERHTAERQTDPISAPKGIAFHEKVNGEPFTPRAGTAFSRYRILERLGGGGMGVVYRAEDTRLGRFVALKFLPEELAQHPSALERFQREARAASALNHANICTIFEVNEIGGQPFIAMELLEGQTLQEGIASKLFKIDELLDVAIQAATAIEAAHSKGFTHRDIKPANIFLTARGDIKVLDFGLAKLDQGAVAGADFQDRDGLTSPGAVLGTVAYMSPEQARGEPLDARTDLFSFGSVLYEMASGQAPFTGATPAVIFEAILNRDPAPLLSLKPQLPARLAQIIDKALEKDRNLRCQTAGELVADLKRLQRDISSGRLASTQLSDSHSAAIAESVTIPHGRGLSTDRTKRRTAIGWAAAFIIAAPIVYALLRPAGSRHAIPSSALELTRVTGSGDIRNADISADGKYVAFVRETAGKQSLWLKQLATGRSLELAILGDDECRGLAFSPDGSYVYFVRKELLKPSGDLYEVPFLGGSSTKLLAGVSGAPAISPDGRKVAFVRSTLISHGEDSIVIASLDGSGERILASYKAPGIHFNRLAWTADGTTLAYPLASGLTTIAVESGKAQPAVQEQGMSFDDLWQLPPGRDLIVVGRLSNSDRPQLFQISLKAGGMREITHDLSNYKAVRSTADGHALLAVQDLILSTIQVLSPGKEADARALSAENENRDGLGGLAWTPDGKIIYSSESDRHMLLLKVDADGSSPRSVATTEPRAFFSNPVVSPRGDFIAVVRWFENDGANIWRMDLSGGAMQRLTTGKQDFLPGITPDGRWVVYASIQGDKSVLMKVPSDGGPAEKLTDYNSDHPSVSPDGKWIACSHLSQQNQSSLAIVPIAGGSPAHVFQLPETASLPPFVWTPNGQAVTFIDHVNGVGNIWQQPLAGGPATPLTHFTSGKIFYFQWSRDGRLAVSRGTETIDAVLIKNFR